VATIGCTCPDTGCSGYFVQCQAIADAVVGLIKDLPSRPVTLWLPGEWNDRGTIAHPAGTGFP
jgi:hypothetical protein